MTTDEGGSDAVKKGSEPAIVDAEVIKEEDVAFADEEPSLRKKRSDEITESLKTEGKPTLRSDLIVLTKFRLNVFVLITTLFGFLLATDSLDAGWGNGRFWLLFHALVGTAAAAFGSAVFNQLMEIDQDRRMKRTADRPLPARRMVPAMAFAIGWSLAAFGIIHLSAKVNTSAAYLAALTIGIYVFVYTPMKRTSSLNTLVGGIPGAIPPMIGWAAAGGGIFSAGSWALFILLFFWQMPHFIAINWLCREEYEKAGYKMWANGDVKGSKSAWLAMAFGVGLAAAGLLPWMLGLCALWAGIVTAAAAMVTVWLALVFKAKKDRPAARKLFFSTLIYLPVALIVLSLGWR